MSQEKLTIQSIAGEVHAGIDYSDEDIVIFDNVKELVAPIASRVNMNLIAVCIHGKVQGKMNDTVMQLAENQVIFCLPNTFFSDLMISPDFEMKAMLLTNRMLQSFLREQMGVWNEVMYVHHAHVWRMKPEDIEFFSHFYEMLRLSITSAPASPYRSDIIHSLLRGAFLGLCGRFREMLSMDDTEEKRHVDGLFQRFLELLGSSNVRHRSVESYASELCVTPKHLSVVCKKNSGKTANEWITEHVVEDIRYYLKSTDLSIKQICDLLGFPNPSFFGKYVKKHFGTTPNRLRRE